MAGERRRWMLFVDGENFTLRGQEVIKEQDYSLVPGKYWLRDVFLWFPNDDAIDSLGFASPVKGYLERKAIRAHYYTSVTSDAAGLEEVREALWRLGFTAEVAKKPKGRRAKAVDIALTKDVLTNAFLDNYDILMLMAGDGDYVPVVNEVKRLGKVVIVAHFGSAGAGLSRELRLSADKFVDIESHFLHRWWRYSMAEEVDQLVKSSAPAPATAGSGRPPG